MFFNPNIFMPGSSVLDPATTAWVNQVVTNGGTVSGGRQTTVNALIAGLKTDGVWTKLDRLWILAAENTPSALTDLVATSLATAVSSPPFTVDRGYAGADASAPTKYIDSGYNPSTMATNYTLNAAHFSAWCVGNASVSVGDGGLGGAVGTGQVLIFDMFSNTDVYGRINDTSGGPLGTAGTRQGHWIADRTNGTTSTVYQNGAVFGSPNSSALGVPAVNAYILAYNNGSNIPVGGSTNITSMTSYGGHLTGTNVTNLYNRLRTYMTAVGVP